MTNVDFSFMHDHKVVIHCETKRESDELIDAIAERFGVDEERACDWKVNWNKYRELTCHRFSLYGKNTISYGFCNVEWYINDGKKIIECSSLTHEVDYGEIDSGFCSNTDALLALF